MGLVGDCTNITQTRDVLVFVNERIFEHEQNISWTTVSLKKY